MQKYLVTVAYTPETRQKLTRHPQDRLSAVIPLVEALGGKIESGWLVLAEFDVVLIVQMPSFTSAAALSSTISAAGAVKDIKVVPLIEIKDWMGAMTKARQANYHPPKG